MDSWLNHLYRFLLFNYYSHILSNNLRCSDINSLVDSNCFIESSDSRFLDNNSLCKVKCLVFHINLRCDNDYCLSCLTDSLILNVQSRNLNLLSYNFNSCFSHCSLVLSYLRLDHFNDLSRYIVHITGVFGIYRYNQVNDLSLSNLSRDVIQSDAWLDLFYGSCCDISLILGLELWNPDVYWFILEDSDVLSRSGSLSSYSSGGCWSSSLVASWNDRFNLINDHKSLVEVYCLILDDRYLSFCDSSLINSNSLILSWRLNLFNNSNCLSLCDCDCLIDCLDLRFLNIHLFNYSHSLIDNWHWRFLNDYSLSIVESKVLHINLRHSYFNSFNNTSSILNINGRHFNLLSSSCSDCFSCECLVERYHWFYNLWCSCCGGHIGHLGSKVCDNGLYYFYDLGFCDLRCLIHCFYLWLDDLNYSSWGNSFIKSRNARFHGDFLDCYINSCILLGNGHCSIGLHFFDHNSCLV